MAITLAAAGRRGRHGPRIRRGARVLQFSAPSPARKAARRIRSPPVNDAWIADRMRHIEASGIRKAFDMAKAMVDPINLSIGLPDFDVAGPVKAVAIEAIERGRNAYTVTQGIPELRGKIQAAVDAEFRHPDRQVLITSGTSGALLLALCCVVDPGDEVIVFDPYFVMYRHLATLAGGTSVLVDTYPDFRIDL